MRPPLQGATVLVTGGSSGIGREIARQLAGKAKALVLAARRADRLDALRQELAAAHRDLRVVVFACDLTRREDCDALLDHAAREAGDIDVLINNAGMGDFGVFDRASWDKTRQMLDINIDALTYLTHRLLPGMVARRRGGILNVSSGFGLEWLPGFAAYSASKHYVTAFTEVVRLDVRGAGVVVSQLCPGPTDTEFEGVMGNFTGRKVPSLVRLSVERCVTWGLRSFARGRALIIPGVVMNLVHLVGALSPRWLKRQVYRLIAPRIRTLQERVESR
jgi:short-subunit dehydrogenase